MQKIISISLLLLLLWGLSSCWKEKQHFVARKGILDLSQEKKIELLRVKGEFFFAWQKILSPKEILQSKDFLPLPIEWNRKNYTPQGYATYSLLIKLPANSKDLGLELPNVATAYRLWFNDSLFTSMGKLATQPDSSVAAYQKNIIKIPNHFLKDNTLQITLQISNFEHFRGGIYYPIYLGSWEEIDKKTKKIRDFELFIMGALLFMAVFHSILYFFLSRRQSNHDSFYLVLICLLVVLRTSLLSVGSQYWRELFPNSSFELMMKTEFFSAYALPLVILLFLDALLPNIINRKIFQAAKYIAWIMLGLAFLPIPTYLYSIPIYYFVIYALYILEIYVCLKAKQKSVKEAYLILVAFLMPMIFSFLETLHHQGVILFAYANITSLGMLLFLFFQSFVISYRIAKAYAKVAYLSKNLEQEVAKRTQELEEQKEELTQSNIILENTKNELERSRESILASIRYAQRVQNAILPSDRYISKFSQDYFIFYQPRDAVSGDFYWFHGDTEGFYVAAADCTGHGVPGAIMATMAYISLDYAFFRKEHQNLGELLQIFDKELVKLLHKNVQPDEEPTQDGLVIALCKVNPKTKELKFASANAPIYIVRGEILIELPFDKHIIGGNSRETKEFTEQTFPLETNDVIYLFSDGYQDQFGGDKKKKLGYRKFKEILLKIAPLPMQEQRKLIEMEFNAWKGNYSQIDDVLVIGIKV
ncbi:MAG: 7TM diverse intracellular signaling domain-containing protein [Raineya sp.]|nr:SpoIIE family protein phosphatase [Raineya sp.]MDW8295901.1 7TM diverse intracellular signaling domain-containing protein [Raineya sp.]